MADPTLVSVTLDPEMMYGNTSWKNIRLLRQWVLYKIRIWRPFENVIRGGRNYTSIWCAIYCL